MTKVEPKPVAPLKHSDVEKIVLSLLALQPKEESFKPEECEKMIAVAVKGILDTLETYEKKGLSLKIDALEDRLQKKIDTLQPKGDYASANHTHLERVISLDDIVEGVKVKKLLAQDFAFADHTHSELTNKIEKIEKLLANLPETKEYDDTAIQARLTNLENKKVETPIVNVQLADTPTYKITCECEYIVVKKFEGSVEGETKKGKVELKVTTDKGKTLIRPIENQLDAITFTFSSPVTLCSIKPLTLNQS